jgi:hypothetical protein
LTHESAQAFSDEMPPPGRMLDGRTAGGKASQRGLSFLDSARCAADLDQGNPPDSFGQPFLEFFLRSRWYVDLADLLMCL